MLRTQKTTAGCCSSTNGTFKIYNSFRLELLEECLEGKSLSVSRSCSRQCAPIISDLKEKEKTVITKLQTLFHLGLSIEKDDPIYI